MDNYNFDDFGDFLDVEMDDEEFDNIFNEIICMIVGNVIEIEVLIYV